MKCQVIYLIMPLFLQQVEFAQVHVSTWLHALCVLLWWPENRRAHEKLTLDSVVPFTLWVKNIFYLVSRVRWRT